ncbi:MAG: (2Fe-2S) ferredoxin domain-containing protein [Alphaproteobacteria bacterium]|nr:(2Fe-2S) ferredoxin domain-containing protein [Alphaproteobacteria bacterium]
MTSYIKVCMGSSCFARGNSKNLQIIQDYIGKNNLDAEIELTGLRCCNNCSKGPNITIDEKEYNNLDSNTLLDILEKHYKANN